MAIISLCLGWIYYSRWSEKRAFIRRLEEPQAAQDRAVLEAYGGGRLTILGFYAAPSIIKRGETTQLCYGVSNSKMVRIEPPIEDVWPSHSRCVNASPRVDTVYKLIAEDAQGHTETASVTVQVR